MKTRLAALLAMALLGGGCVVDPGPYTDGSYGSPVDQTAPVGSGGVAISWTLSSGGQSLGCAQAGVGSVAVNLQDPTGLLVFGPAGASVACADFTGNYNVAVFDQVAPGSYQVLVTAEGPGTTYVETGPAAWVTVADGSFADPTQPVVVPLDDQGAAPTGGLALSWSLYSGGAPVSCAQAGVDTVTVNLQDSMGNLLYGPAGISEACADAMDNPNVALLSGVPAGDYQILMTASGVGGTFAESGPAPTTVAPDSVADPTQPVTVSLYQ